MVSHTTDQEGFSDLFTFWWFLCSGVEREPSRVLCCSAQSGDRLPGLTATNAPPPHYKCEVPLFCLITMADSAVLCSQTTVSQHGNFSVQFWLG
jgi:hypothetical protein